MDAALVNYLQQLSNKIQEQLDAQEQEKAQENQKWLTQRESEFDRVMDFVPDPLRPYCHVNADRYGAKNDFPIIIRLPRHATIYADAYVSRYENGMKLRLTGGGRHDSADTDVASVIDRARRDWQMEQATIGREFSPETVEPEPASCEPTPIEQMRAAIAAENYAEVQLWAEVVKAEALHALAARGASF